MENEIINIENTPEIGILEAFSCGLKYLFKNIKPVSKMMLFPFMLFASIAICILPPLFCPKNLPVVLLSFILGLCMMFYWFWQYMLGTVAISYLAKDIYENKPVQKTKDYIKYVKAHSASFIKYILWSSVIMILPWVLLMLIFAFLIMLGLSALYLQNSALFALLFIFAVLFIFSGAILLAPLGWGTYISILFWAYGDKNKPLNSIIKSIKASYKLKNIPWLFIIFLIFNTLISTIAYAAGFCTGLILAFVSNISEDMYFLIGAIVAAIVFLPFHYAFIFVFTRCYFEINKN